jgi:predicted house-cleaning noncanonical NTP pyrophosphatase (MazG superfamily)
MYIQQYPMAFHRYLNSEDYQTNFQKNMLEEVAEFVGRQQAKDRGKFPKEDQNLTKLLFLIGRSLFSSKEFVKKAMMEDELDLDQAKYELKKLTGLSYDPTSTADLSRSYLDNTKFYACKIKASANKADYKKLHFYFGVVLNCAGRGGIKIFELWNLERYTEIVPVQYKDEIWVIIGSGNKKFKVVTSAEEKYKGKYGIQKNRTVIKPAKATWDALDQGIFKINSDLNRKLGKYGLWVRE